MCERNFCDYNSYYHDQSGGNLDVSYYRGLPYQRGYGRFTNLARRFGVPALKYLVKHGWELGKDVFSDLRDGKKVGTSFKSNLRKRAATAMKDFGEKISQSGTGLRKRPRLLKKRRIRKKKSISSKNKKRKVGRKRKSKKRCRKSKRSRKNKIDIFNKNVF